jgi:hypothetical protein
MDFTDLTTTKLGEYGEEIVKKRLIQKGYKIAQFMENSSHPIDIIAYKDGKFLFIDVKTKPEMIKYPATGIDDADYVHYKKMSDDGYNVILLFVDHKKASIYGGNINDLKPCPSLPTVLTGCDKHRVDIRVFSTKNMRHFEKLTDAECCKLNELDNSNYKG